MGLKQQIETDIKKAILGKDQDTLRALRSIKSLILLAETEKGGKEGLTNEREMQLLTKAAKQRKESIELFAQQGREDLVAKEQAELEVINRYLPQPMTEAELLAAVQQIVNETGAGSMQDMGKVMGAATQRLAGKAEGKDISRVVKQVLSKA